MKANLSFIETKFGKMTARILKEDDFEFLIEHFSDKTELLYSGDSPLSVMFQLYKSQLKKGKVDPGMEKFIISASGEKMRGRELLKATQGKERGKKGIRGQEDGQASALKLPKYLTQARDSLLECISQLESKLEKGSKVFERLSVEMLTASRRELAILRSEVEQRVEKIALIENHKLQKEKTEELTEQMNEIITRTEDAQKLRIKMLREGGTVSRPKEIPTVDLKFLAEGINAKDIASESKRQGLTAHIVDSPLSQEYVTATNLLYRFFPPDELDAPVLTMDIVKRTSKGVIEQNPQGKDEYARYGVFYIKDKEGKIIGAADGLFSANKEITAFYLAHIVVLPEFRRSQVATFLETAIINKCEEFARDAEKKLKTTYPEGKMGNKMMFLMLESEFASLRPSELSATLGRLIFHGVNGFSIVPAARYLQSDTEWEEGSKPYNSKEWGTVPLYFAIRGVGHLITGEITMALLRLIYNGFVSAGLCKEGIETDYKYATEKLKGNVDVVPLPKSIDGLQAFIQTQGDSISILKRDFPPEKFSWVAEYLSSSESALSLIDAISRFRELTEKVRQGRVEPPIGI